MNSTTSNPITKLEDIVARKNELKQQILKQKTTISSSSQTLFKPANLYITIFQNLMNGLKVFDNVLLGYGVFNTVRKLFRKR